MLLLWTSWQESAQALPNKIVVLLLLLVARLALAHLP
jgi:hypothetical protein